MAGSQHHLVFFTQIFLEFDFVIVIIGIFLWGKGLFGVFIWVFLEFDIFIVIEMLEFELIFDTVISLYLCKHFAFIEPLSESFVPTFAEVKLFSSWDIELFHDLFGLL